MHLQVVKMPILLIMITSCQLRVGLGGRRNVQMQIQIEGNPGDSAVSEGNLHLLAPECDYVIVRS